MDFLNNIQPRETALKVLYEINEKGAYSNIALNKFLKSSGHTEKDNAFITEIVYGTVKWKSAIDLVIEKYSKIKLKKLSPYILNILRMGVYQILYMDKVPDSAACNESVKLARKYGHEASSRYVNAVLRSVARENEAVGNGATKNETIVNKAELKDLSHLINYPDKVKQPAAYLSARYSHPEWMAERWISRFGIEFTESLLEANSKNPDFTLRVNLLKASREELAESLRNRGYVVENGKYLPYALVVKNPSSIMMIDEYKEGLFNIQDESSMLASQILNPQPGWFVIDVCAAPGGKTAHIAQLMNNTGKVIAGDIHEHKIALIQQTAKRLGASIVETMLHDAAVYNENLGEKADAVLVDAPCTGYGIIRRKPDIKWTSSPGEIAEITKLQARILDNASKYVKPGGVIVYSTCTIEKEENEMMVENFVASHPDFYLEDISSFLPEGLKKPEAKNGYIQIYPNVDNIDGFFISRMRRRQRCETWDKTHLP